MSDPAQPALILFAITVGILFAVTYVGIAVHELGHLFAALLGGWRPYRIEIGAGKQLKLGSPASLEVCLGLWPVSGMVHAFALSPTWYRTRFIFFILGGPFATVAYISFLFFVLPQFTPDHAHSAIGVGGFIQFWMLLRNALWPNLVRIRGHMQPNDCLSIWTAARLPGSKIPHQFAHGLFHYANLLIDSNRSSTAQDFLYRSLALSGLPPMDTALMKALWLAGSGFSEEAKEKLNDAAALADATGEAYDELASNILFAGCEALFPQALELIEKGIQLEPDTITLHGTKASLLIETGELQAGLELLDKVIATTKSNHDRAICTYYRALTQNRLGRSQEAREELAKAESIDPNSPVAKRIAELIRSAQPSLAPSSTAAVSAPR